MEVVEAADGGATTLAIHVMEEKLLDQEVGVIVALSGVKFELSGAREDTGNGRDGVCPEEPVLE